jgi:hypothetical protein
MNHIDPFDIVNAYKQTNLNATQHTFELLDGKAACGIAALIYYRYEFMPTDSESLPHDFVSRFPLGYIDNFMAGFDTDDDYALPDDFMPTKPSEIAFYDGVLAQRAVRKAGIPFIDSEEGDEE